MSDVNVILTCTEGMKFTCVNMDGQETIIDGKKKEAASPMEVLLESLGACTGSDIVLILEKMRTPAERLEIAVAGKRRDTEPRYYTDVRLRFDVWGEGIDSDKMARAVSLSLEKYCSVYLSLRQDLKTTAEFRTHAPGAQAAGDYQV
ncbi:MAG: OsmC family protein, partial [Blastocatellia bacterium]|nr:OsmC family protein [Blastocatellia bacterium]